MPVSETFLLKEDGGFLLKEDGGNLVLNRITVVAPVTYSHVTLGSADDTRQRQRNRPKQILRLTVEIPVKGIKIVKYHTKADIVGLVKKTESTKIPFETILVVRKKTAVPVEQSNIIARQRTLCAVSGVKKPDTVSLEIINVVETLRGIHKIMAKQDKLNTLKRLLEKVTDE